MDHSSQTAHDGGDTPQDGAAVRIELEDMQRTLAPILESLQPAAASAMASGVVAAANAGLEGAAVAGTQALLGLNMENFARDIVLCLVRDRQAHTVGKISVAAVENGAASLVQQLSVALLSSGHVEEAARVSAAFWDAAIEAGMHPLDVAASVAPAVAEAVDRGHSIQVAGVQRALLDSDHAPMAMWLLVALVERCSRLDAAASGTWTAVKEAKNGGDTVAAIAALSMLEGHADVVASVASRMHQLAKKDGLRDAAVAVVAAAASEAASVDRPDAVVAVSERLMELGEGDLVADSMAKMVEQGHNERVGKISLNAVMQKKTGLVAVLTRELAGSGKLSAATTAAGAAGMEAWRVLTSAAKDLRP
jgi:hypothetical protein